MNSSSFSEAHVFELHLVAPQEDGSLKRRLSGRFAVRIDADARAVEVQLDLDGHLQELHGLLTPAKERLIESLKRSAYYEVVAMPPSATAEVVTGKVVSFSKFKEFQARRQRPKVPEESALSKPCPDCGTPLDDDGWCRHCEWPTGCELDENFKPRS